MWSNLPSDLLSIIFSYLPPHYLARAMATCRNWHDCGRRTAVVTIRHRHPPWFIALPTRSNGLCFVHNPIQSTWHQLNLDYAPGLITRPVSSIAGHGLILFKSTGSVPVKLSVCDPFTREFRRLPLLRKPRINPAIGIIEDYNHPTGFKIYVAGGMCEAASDSAASYEPTIEMFDSKSGEWTLVGSMPVEFAVRLTVWTPNESVYSREGILYWMTSARTYSIMGFDMGFNKWKEVSVPMGDTLEFAAMVPRDGKLTVVGGTHGRGDVMVWELGEGGEWNVIDKMPIELGKRLIGGSSTSGSIKCVGIEGCVCLYNGIGNGMVVWRRGNENGWEWNWIEGCNKMSGKGFQPIRGLFLHPNLAYSSFISSV